MKKYLLIVNPHSGSQRSRNASQRNMAIHLLACAGHNVSVLYTQHAGHAQQIAQQNIGSYDVICAVGGDGTVNEVASALTNTPQAMGIIPTGSGNGLARELGIPMHIKGAVEVLLKDNRIRIDTCTANNEPFFCTCGIGFDGKVSNEFAKSDTRGPLTYFKDSLYSFFTHNTANYTLGIDDQTYHHKAFLIACANASQYGNNAFIAPDASLTDGLLDITVIKDAPKLEVAQIGIQLFSKGIEKNAFTQTYRGKKVHITTPTAVPYHIDGEPRPATKELTIDIHPQNLTVVSGDMGNRSEKSALNFLNQITNNYFAWKSELVKEVLDFLNDLANDTEA